MIVPSLLELLGAFFYIGLFAVGGGLVSITFMQQIVVERGWITFDKFYNMIAISESTPGPIGVNMATYIGYEFYGVLGGILTTFAQVSPAIICILIIAKFFQKFQEKPMVKSVFSVLRPVTSGIVLVATVQVISLSLLNLPKDFSSLLDFNTWKSLFRFENIIFYALALVTLFKTKVHPVIIIASGAIFGVLFL